MLNRLRVRNVGPIREADVRFRDLTVFVGPQATGKSIFLQLLKLVVDKPSVHTTMKQHGINWGHSPDGFLDLYFGEGMAAIRSDGSELLRNDTNKPVGLASLTRPRTFSPPEIMFYIPAHRVLSLRDGITHPFLGYRAGDPYVLRDFSQKLHTIVQNEFGANDAVFPRPQRLSKSLRKPLFENIFGRFELRTDSSMHHRRLVLQSGEGRPLPYLVWSAGQREFVPLLLGLYWLMPPSRISRRDDLKWVVIEEPETGLHPDGIGAVLCLVMELLRRGYRVCVSTHSPHVLDVVWALKVCQEDGAETRDVIGILGLSSNRRSRELAKRALESTFGTYFFARDGHVRDISGLDPGSEDEFEEGWGGLTGFTGRISRIVSDVSARAADS